MEYPLILDLDIIQDDFIQVELLEQAIDVEQSKKDYKNLFKIQRAGTALLSLAMGAVILKGIISPLSLIIPAFALAVFTVGLYFNITGAKREFAMAAQHLISHRENSTFFTPERGMAYFYRDRCEYLTNEQRRYFDYSLIKHIKITRLEFIFVMKKSKEKNLKGFAYMIIPKRNLAEGQEEFLQKICRDIIEKYSLSPWTDISILD